MSTYLYTFDTKAKVIDGQQVYRLAFKRGNAMDMDSNVQRLCQAARDRFANIPLPSFYIEGMWEVGALVWRSTEPIRDPVWFDTAPMPGKARVYGALRKNGKTWEITTVFDVVRRECKRDERGIIHFHPADPIWPVTGAGSLDYSAAVVQAGLLNKQPQIREPGGTAYHFEVRS